MVDAVASDYQEQVTFLAVAGRSSPEASAARVGDWFSPDRILWGYSDELWPQYEVFGQPVTFLVSSDDVIVSTWFGALGEEGIRDALDYLVTIG